MLLQRLERGVQAEPLAAFRLERAKRPRTIAVDGEVPLAKASIQEFEHFELGRSHAGVVHEPGRAEPLQARLESRRPYQAARPGTFAEVGYGFHVEIENVQPRAARWPVGTRLFPLGRGEGAQRAYRHDAALR